MPARFSSDSISIACPACGYETLIRVDRLSHAHTCRSCDTPYRVNGKGNCVVDRERIAKRRTAWLQRHRDRWEKPVRRLMRPLAEKWGPLSARAKQSIVATVALFSILMAGAWAWTAWTHNRDAAEEPESLSVRAEAVCRALVFGDSGLLEGITAPETSGDARTWLAKARHYHWGRYESGGSLIRVQSRPLFKNEGRREAVLVCNITAPINGGRGPTTATVERALFWTLRWDGKWMFDGARTWREFQNERSD